MIFSDFWIYHIILILLGWFIYLEGKDFIDKFITAIRLMDYLGPITFIDKKSLITYMGYFSLANMVIIKDKEYILLIVIIHKGYSILIIRWYLVVNRGMDLFKLF